MAAQSEGSRTWSDIKVEPDADDDAHSNAVDYGDDECESEADYDDCGNAMQDDDEEIPLEPLALSYFQPSSGSASSQGPHVPSSPQLMTLVPSLPFAASEAVEEASVVAHEQTRTAACARTEMTTTDLTASSHTGTAMEVKARQILCTHNLLSTLIRPVTSTPQNIKSLVACALTLKIDGVRTLLLISHSRVEAIVHGEVHVIVDGPYDPDADTLSILDCELHDSKAIYAFDMLAFDDIDIRHRTLPERLQAMSQRLPPCVHAKPYKIASSEEDARVCAQSLFEQKTDDFDGLILLNYTDPYWIPPLKFKEQITCDFILESSTHTPNGYVLLSETRTKMTDFSKGGKHAAWTSRQDQWKKSTSGQWSHKGHKHSRATQKTRVVLKPRKDKGVSSYSSRSATNSQPIWYKHLEVLRENGQIVTVKPSIALATALNLQPNIRRTDAIVCECRRSRQGQWIITRMRPDRTRPNSTQVVTQNVNMALGKCTNRSWLLRNLPLQNDYHIFLRYVESCVRCCVAHNQQSSDKVVEIGSSSIRHFISSGFKSLEVLEPQTKRHDYRLANSHRLQGRVSFSTQRFSPVMSCDRLLSFFTINEHFEHPDKLRAFVNDVAKVRPRQFCGLMWCLCDGPIAAAGRYSLRTDDTSHANTPRKQFTYGQRMILQLSANEVMRTYNASLDELKSLFADVDYMYQCKDMPPSPSPMNGCPPSYVPLGHHLIQFNFLRA